MALSAALIFTLTWMMIRNPGKWFEVAVGFMVALRSLLFGQDRSDEPPCVPSVPIASRLGTRNER